MGFLEKVALEQKLKVDDSLGNICKTSRENSQKPEVGATRKPVQPEWNDEGRKKS